MRVDVFGKLLPPQGLVAIAMRLTMLNCQTLGRQFPCANSNVQICSKSLIDRNPVKLNKSLFAGANVIHGKKKVIDAIKRTMYLKAR